MGGKHGCSEKARAFVITKKVFAYRIANGDGYDKGEKTKPNGFVSVFQKIIHIKFKSCDKHNIQQSNSGE